MSLLIEQLTKEASVEVETGVEKTAEEAQMEKLAHEINVLDQSRSLVAVGEEMYKIAQELENEAFTALAIDTYNLGERMGSCLTKTASEDGSALLEALEIAEDMNKIASVYAELADETQDETLVKMAEAIIAISNELTEDANEVYKMASEEGEEEEEEEEEGVEKEATIKNKVFRALIHSKNAVKDAGKSANRALIHSKNTVKDVGKEAKIHFWDQPVNFFKKTDVDTGTPGTHVSMLHRLKQFGTKEGMKTLVAPAALTIALADAGYRAKKLYFDKKKKK